MPISSIESFDGHQVLFHQRWSSVRDPHVRTLAWLLDAPGLLDAHAACWDGKVATLGGVNERDVAWLHQLDAQPEALHRMLNAQSSVRLGHYAEKLLGFYLRQTGQLIAHNVQVRDGANDTIGEFDFLVRGGQGMVHWEFATKFYLLALCDEVTQATAFVGPNLADSLGAKMRKIMQQQLRLSQHPCAQQYLPEPVTAARALVKGWLFYHHPVQALSPSLGLAADHCRGFWCDMATLDVDSAQHYLILPCLSWLAPARGTLAEALSPSQLCGALAVCFRNNPVPVLIAACDLVGDVILERQRGFVVPDDWMKRAALVHASI